MGLDLLVIYPLTALLSDIDFPTVLELPQMWLAGENWPGTSTEPFMAWEGLILADPLSLADDNKKRDIDLFVKLINAALKTAQSVIVTIHAPDKTMAEARKVVGNIHSCVWNGWCGKCGIRFIMPQSQWDEIHPMLAKMGIPVTDIKIQTGICFIGQQVRKTKVVINPLFR